MRYIDLRSDTVTMPTQEMREAMSRAPVGDDVYGDDPTVNQLEELAAERLGKEAALFVASGTQGNMVSILAHTRRGDAVILGREHHIWAHETGSYGMIAGVSAQPAGEVAGIIQPESVRQMIMDESDPHLARTGLLCLENALSNGNVVPVDTMKQLYETAKEREVPVHLDGARLFNAATYLNVGVKEMTRYADSVMCCLSKGLCAPVGSVVAGPADFIRRARRARKTLGGGMRQAGILAAAGILALTKMTGRLQEDHDNALYLADRLATIPGVKIQRELLKINMVFFHTDWPQPVLDALPQKLLDRGIKIGPCSQGIFRFVTNNDVTRADCDTVVAAIKESI